MAILALAGCVERSDEASTDVPASGYVFDDRADAPEPIAEPETDAKPEDASAGPEPEPTVAAPSPSAPRRTDNSAARLACEDSDGNFTRTKAGAFLCVYLTGQGQKSCSSPDDCRGECLARSQTCAPTTPLIGCHDLITRSGGMATVCID